MKGRRLGREPVRSEGEKDNRTKQKTYNRERRVEGRRDGTEPHAVAAKPEF